MKINANIFDPGIWADPKVWLIAAAALIVLIIIGIYMKVFIEHQRFNMHRSSY